MKFNKLTTVALFCFSLINASNTFGASNKNAVEINELKQKITKMQVVDGESISMNERFYKHKLAITQVKMLKKVAAYETYMFLAKSGTRGNLSEINKIVDVAWECSWTFTDLGSNHMDRFRRIMGWCKGETNFRGNCVSIWKKGQYIKSMNIIIKKDTADYGAWQINIDNLSYAKKTYSLYRSGVVCFKIVRVRKPEDLFDIPTNCAVRCAIETDRKSMGMEWKHRGRPDDRAYIAHLSKKINELEDINMYDEALVSNFYKLTPIKRYCQKP